MGEATAATSTVPGSGQGAKRALGYARYVFWLMFLINFFNYVDRWVFTGLSPIIQQALHINDFGIGVLSSAFLIVYLIVAAPLGFLADRLSRKLIVGVGVGVWSLANAFTGLVTGFGPLLAVRSFLGIGEGSYYPAGTPLLAAYYPPSKRSQVLSRWSVGALLGAAVGFLIASPFSSASAWRYAFFFTGVPGLILAVLMLLVREKTRHEEDPIAEEVGASAKGELWHQRLRVYLRIPTVRVIIGLHALGFFGLAGLTSFLPIYLNDAYGSRVNKYDDYGNLVATVPGAFPHAGLSPHLVPILAGVIVLLGGILGTLAGGIWANRLSRGHTGARVLVGGLGFLIAAPCVLVAIGSGYILPLIPAYAAASEGTRVTVGVAVLAVFAILAAFFLNVYNGPVSAALLDVLPPDERAAAGGTELTLAHLLGDSYAPALIGAIATFFFANRIGLGLLVTTPIALVASGIIGIWGSRFYARDVQAVGTTAEAMLGTASTTH